MISYEDLPKVAQKACNLTNKVRIVALFIGYAIVAMLYNFYKTKKVKKPNENIIAGLK